MLNILKNLFSSKKTTFKSLKTLFIVRHAKSSWTEMDVRDFDRKLDLRGHNDAPRMAKMLKSEGFLPDLMVSSPAMRAKTTANYFATEFGFDPQNFDFQQDIYEAREIDILNVVRDLPNTAKVVLLFGHNPSLTYFTNRYNENPIDNLPTCGIIRIDLNVEDWSKFGDKTAKVTGMWYPKMYK
jgi:phosphohistidine phosphatase